MKVSKQDLDAILSCQLLRGIKEETALRVLSSQDCKTCSVSAGELIMSPEDTDHRVGFLLRGKATILTPGQSKSTLMRFLNKGEAFGVSRLFSDTPFVSFVRAKSECRVLLISEDALLSLMESDTAFLRRYLSFLSERIQYLNRKITYLCAGSAERKLALYLLSFGEDNVSLPLSLSALSELLDIGRASLYRAFSKLGEDGYIQKDGKVIRLLQREALNQAYQ